MPRLTTDLLSRRPSTSSAWLLATATAMAILPTLATAACYDRGGKLRESWVACNPDQPTSSCCSSSDFCMSNGLCLNAGGNQAYTQQGCTDKKWGPPCTFYCRESFCIFSPPPLGSKRVAPFANLRRERIGQRERVFRPGSKHALIVPALPPRPKDLSVTPPTACTTWTTAGAASTSPQTTGAAVSGAAAATAPPRASPATTTSRSPSPPRSSGQEPGPSPPLAPPARRRRRRR
ncbi:uncharacterized protein B0I36DRAFT_163120 [Microdochium trichocladiopsis]|uniref:Uncharacterized protein n=1 Tax=Microdochium trichocladiopsis TaxID=1682393 RepID=A0A9P8XXX4_9PEZI|nr:uncharacterized protein B0I36DRAFT_163120 [Microdochium trichocladiopsis]KAH7024605.1 hypothetical protein B0I36DRAFT_163120 [Microdochium trichocladiopsis]